MNAKTLRALKASIKHWERLTTGALKPNENIRSDDCALCKAFNRVEMTIESLCTGCPVSERTQRKLCQDSPYNAAAQALEKYGGIDTPEFRVAALKQLYFLQSLLPEKSS